MEGGGVIYCNCVVLPILENKELKGTMGRYVFSDHLFNFVDHSVFKQRMGACKPVSRQVFCPCISIDHDVTGPVDYFNYGSLAKTKDQYGNYSITFPVFNIFLVGTFT